MHKNMDLLIVPAFMWTRILNKYAWLPKLRWGHGQVHQTSHIKLYTPADINADICMGMYANIYLDTSADKDMNFFPYVDDMEISCTSESAPQRT